MNESVHVMPVLTINGTNYSDFVQAFTGSSPAPGQYYALPPFGMPPLENIFQYQEQHITFPGVLNAMGTKRIAFGPRIISCELIVIGASKAAAAGSAAALLLAMAQLQRYTITLPDGVSRPGCKYLNATEDSWVFGFLGAWAVVMSCSFIQLQDS